MTSSQVRKYALHAFLEETAKTSPNKTALVYGDQELSYSQLHSDANRFANALIGFGLRKGDRVALHLPNSPQFVIAFFGALKAGAVVTAISPLHKVREIQAQLVDSGAKTIITLDSFRPLLTRVNQKIPFKHVMALGAEDVTLSGLLSHFSPSKPSVEVCSDDLATLQYTGGTTGTPKAAMLTHRNLASNATQFAAAIKATGNDVFLNVLPLFHIYGLTTSLTVPISVGAKIVLLPKFEAAKALDAIQKHKVTVFCGVPTMYQLLLGAPTLPNFDLKSVRVCISGASALPSQVQKEFMAVTGGFLAEGYGLTEASPVTHCNPVDKEGLHVGSIGLPLPDTEVRIVDLETGSHPLKTGEVGELAVKGPQVMTGYWNRPDETAMVLRDGWLLTGDIARIDQDGYYYIVDRKKDLIKHKGYSIYPRELEDLLYEHPKVKLCAVIGESDGLGDEVPVAFVVLKDGSEASAEEIKAFVNGKVAVYKAIHRVELRGELPLSPAGKVLKRSLKA